MKCYLKKQQLYFERVGVFTDNNLHGDKRAKAVNDVNLEANGDGLLAGNESTRKDTRSRQWCAALEK